MAKKCNLRSFFKNTKELDILSDLYHKHGVTNSPFVPENTDPKERAKMLYEFYQNQDIEPRQNIQKDLTVINQLASMDGVKILDKVFKDQKESVGKILSESAHDIAIAYFLQDEELFNQGIKINTFYTKSGWQRYPAQTKSVSDMYGSDRNIEKAFADLLKNDNGRNKISSNTIEYNENYLTTISFYDAPSIEQEFNDKNQSVQKIKSNVKEIYFVYLKERGEVLLKANGKADKLYEYAECYMRNLTGESIENKKIAYDIERFLTSENKQNPLGDFTGVRSWQIKSIDLIKENSKQKVKFTVPTLSEKPGMTQILEMFEGFNLQSLLNGAKIEKVNFMVSLFNSDNIDKKVNVNCTISKNNTCNLNILNPYHEVVDKMLQKAAVNIGFIAIDGDTI
jgi:hypothetical protein